jgi:predicted secreted Zn-dependent protease
MDELVTSYLQLRTLIQDKEEQHKTEIAELKEQMDALSAQLLDVCNETNADSIKTKAGTVSRRVQSRYWSSDWESMHQFILQNEAPFLLEHRIHNVNMRQFLDDNPDLFPAGLQVDSKYVIQVRKPTAR